MMALQFAVSLVNGPNSASSKNNSAKQGVAMPAGRSAGSISAIHSGLDKSAAMAVRQTDMRSDENARINEKARKVPLKPEKVILLHAKRKEEPKNPADVEIY